MNLNQDKQLISKEIILQHFTDVDIFQKYIDIPIQLGKVMLSPLRKERNASFGFFKGQTGEICFKDYLVGGGDFIQFVKLKFNLNYFEALSKIAIDFDIADGYIVKNFKKDNQTSNISSNREEILSSYVPLNLKKRRREWNTNDRDFWTQFGITLDTLKKYNVEPVEYIFINDKIIKTESLAYCFIEYKDDNETYKIYQPLSKDFKWINNHDDSVWQGWDQLPEKGDSLIITKSLKDVMSLYDVAGVAAISLQCENILPKRHVFEQLNERFVDCYSLYDNDFDKDINWGKKFGDKISREYGLIELYIPDEYGSKDFSDFVKNHGKETASKVLQWDMMIPF